MSLLRIRYADPTLSLFIICLERFPCLLRSHYVAVSVVLIIGCFFLGIWYIYHIHICARIRVTLARDFGRSTVRLRCYRKPPAMVASLLQAEELAHCHGPSRFPPGETLRDVYTHGVITSDFVLVFGDLVSNGARAQNATTHEQGRHYDDGSQGGRGGTPDEVCYPCRTVDVVADTVLGRWETRAYLCST